MRLKVRTAAIWRKKWVRVTALVAIIPVVALCFAAGYYYVSFARLIDQRLQGARLLVLPRVFAQPLELHHGQSLTDRQLVDRLNDLGYAQRPNADKPGEFVVENGVVSIRPRPAQFKGELVRVAFQPPAPPRQKPPRRTPPPAPADHVLRIEIGKKATERITLDAPVLTALIGGEREKRRPVALTAIPPRVVQAVLAIEDRRYYYHLGVDPIRLVGALVGSLTSDTGRIAATSTITQQLVRNVFLPQFAGWTLQSARERSVRRKLLEQFLALVLDTRASKDEILEMYLNDMPLGQRGSFAIFGVAEAARLFFGKDVSNVSLAEAATMAGVLQSPSSLSPFNNPDRCKERRNVVIQAMVDADFITADEAFAASREPLVVVQRALEAEAPHFVDYITQTIDKDYPGLTTTTDQAVDVYTTLDLHLQRIAQDAVRGGPDSAWTNCSRGAAARGARRRRSSPSIRAAATSSRSSAAARTTSPSTTAPSRRGVSQDRSSSPSSTSRRSRPPPTPGSTDVTPASLVDDAPTTWSFDDQTWAPENYEHEYDGFITLRRALALSRNVATVKVAEHAGYGRVADLWTKIGAGGAPKAYPSIALGVFEATPYEIARAYTIFPNMGVVRPLRHILRIEAGVKDVTRQPSSRPKAVARPATTFLVTNMMRSVLNEGTGAGCPERRLQARRRRQDRHDQRSARRLVRRIHARAPDGRLGRVRRQPAARVVGRPGGAADLDRVHEAGARRHAPTPPSKRRKASPSSTSIPIPASSPSRAARG